MVATGSSDATVTDCVRDAAADVTTGTTAEPAVAGTLDPERRAAISAAQATRLASVSRATAAASPVQPPPAAVAHLTWGVGAQLITELQRASRFTSADAAAAGALTWCRSVAATWWELGSTPPAAASAAAADRGVLLTAAVIRVLWWAATPAGGALSADRMPGVKADIPTPGVASSPDVNRGVGTNSEANAMVLGMGGEKGRDVGMVASRTRGDRAETDSIRGRG